MSKEAKSMPNNMDTWHANAILAIKDQCRFTSRPVNGHPFHINKYWYMYHIRAGYPLYPYCPNGFMYSHCEMSCKVVFCKLVLRNIHKAKMLRQSQRTPTYDWTFFLYKVMSFLFIFKKKLFIKCR